MKPGFDVILWLLIAGTASLIIWMLFTSLGSGAYPFPPSIPTFDPSPPPDISTPSTKPTTPDLHTPSTSSPSPVTNPSSTIKPTTSEFCTSKGCTRAASLLISSIDPEIDPCVDFYEFSCRGYIKDRSLPRGINIISATTDPMKRFENAAIEYLLAVPLKNQSSIADKKVARFFHLCLDADRDGIKPFAPIIRKAGGLPFQGNPRPELKDLIEQLGVDTFPLWKIESRETTGKVYLRTPQLLTPARLRKTREFLKEVARLLARDMNTTVNDEVLSSQLDAHVNLLIAIEKIKSDNLLEIDVKGRKDNTFAFTLEQMEENFPWIPWRAFAGPIDLSTVRFVGEINYTRAINDLWQNGMLNEKNLKEWYVSEYLYKHLMLFGAEYHDLFEDQSGAKIEMGTFCFYYMLGLMPRWLDAFFAEKFAKLKDYMQLAKLGANVKGGWIETMRENAWIESETKENIAREITDMKLFFGIIVPQYSQEKLDGLYSLFDPNDSPTLAEFVRNVPIAEIQKQFNDSFMSYVSFLPNAMNGGPLVLVYAAITEEPFYADDYPLEYKYGVIGFTIGHELTHTFDPISLDRELLVRDDPQQYEEKVECIVNEYSNITYPLSSFNDTYKYDGQRVQGETASDNTGMRAAFRAYRKERARLYGDYPAKLPGLAEYTNDQLFFISFAHNWCTRENEINRLDSFGDEHPLYKTRVNEGVKNFEAFSDAFSCKPDSPMNPPKKCRIWRHRHRRQ